jgi:hypothetical protein
LALTSECNCSICTKKGCLHVLVPPERFQLLSGGDGDLTIYRFNTGAAKHQFCRHCGIHAFCVPRSEPDKIAVNVRCLDGLDPGSLRPIPFDGRNWEEALAARNAARAATKSPTKSPGGS